MTKHNFDLAGPDDADPGDRVLLQQSHPHQMQISKNEEGAQWLCNAMES
jgi:hypothetical protein